LKNNVVLKSELETYKNARFREKEARLLSESLLENKTRELYLSNQELTQKIQELERYTAEISLFLSLSKFSQGGITFKGALQFYVDAICQLEKWPVAHVYVPKENNSKELVSSGIWHIENEIQYHDLINESNQMTFKEGMGFPGRILATGEPIYIDEIEKCSFYTRVEVCKKVGIRGTIGIPIKCNENLVAVAEFFLPNGYAQNEDKQNLLLTFSKQLEMLLERHKAQEEARENNFKLQQALLELQKLAHNDPLTHLPNRLQFELTLQREIASAKRYNQKLALLYIDLDDFKSINDQLGHDVGDLLLTEVSKRFLSSVRSDDFVARLGGDEFAVVAKIKKSKDAGILSGKILDKLKKPCILNDNVVSISASIGIGCYPEAGNDYVTLCKNADIAMYKTKESGRNNYKIFDVTLQSSHRKRLEIENSINFALKRNEFYLVYQPIYKLMTNKARGMEALIRWNHPEYGLISPDDFIPIAEEKGTIIPIGEWVLRTACQQYMEWRKNIKFDLNLLINISVRQLKEKSFLKSVIQILKETKMPCEKLEFEITETAVMSNQYECLEVLQSIKDLGIKIAIDDFGTGYSSLNRLKTLPISSLKIDKSFIKDIGEKDNNDLIIKSIISLAKELHLDTIAEGVETKEQKKFLLDHSCLNAQGYFFNYPLSIDDMHNFLRINGSNKYQSKKAIESVMASLLASK